LFCMPRQVGLRLKKIQRDFLWGGGALMQKPHLNPEEERGGWTPRFSKPFNDWEMESVKRFLMKLHAKRVHSDVEDKVIWTASRKGNFSIKSLYSALEPGDPLLFPSNIIWSFCAPPKVAFFAWEAT
ncbi:hypothetical protein CK203_097811, partial [Vitis vinifera]